MNRIFRRACHDTFAGGGTTWAVGLISAGAFFGLFQRFFGEKAALEEFKIWLVSVAGGAFGVLLLFLWNLSQARYRIERDNRIEIEKERDKLLKSIQTKPKNRELTNGDKSRLREAIREISADLTRLNVAYIPVSEEAMDFAAEIAETISSAGISSLAIDPPFMDHDPRDRGIKLFHSDHEEMRAKATVLKQAIENGRYEVELRPSDGKEPHVFLYIARSADIDAVGTNCVQTEQKKRQQEKPPRLNFGVRISLIFS